MPYQQMSYELNCGTCSAIVTSTVESVTTRQGDSMNEPRQNIRQHLLDLLGIYESTERPMNEDLLKLFIEATEDKILAEFDKE